MFAFECFPSQGFRGLDAHMPPAPLWVTSPAGGEGDFLRAGWSPNQPASKRDDQDQDRCFNLSILLSKLKELTKYILPSLRATL